MIQIFVKGLEGKTSTHNFPGITTEVDALFDTLANQLSIDRNELRILYGTHQLECGKGKTFEDYGMGNLATCFLVLRLPGGHNPRAGHDPVKKLYLKKQSLEPLDGYITLTLEPCMITLDDDANMNRAKMPCGHVISPMAMTQYCRSLLDEKRSSFPCPYVGGKDGDRCSATWQFFLVKHVAALDQEELTEFETKLTENFARRSMGVQPCPGCQSFCMKANKADIIVRCPVCTKRLKEKYDFCWCCLHLSSSTRCQNPQCDGQDPRMRYLETCPRKEIVGVPECPTLRACVKCGILIEHTEACKHMTCTVCKTSFCFICLKEQSNSKWQCGSYKSKCTPAPVQTAIQGS